MIQGQDDISILFSGLPKEYPKESFASGGRADTSSKSAALAKAIRSHCPSIVKTLKKHCGKEKTSAQKDSAIIKLGFDTPKHRWELLEKHFRLMLSDNMPTDLSRPPVFEYIILHDLFEELGMDCNALPVHGLEYLDSPYLPYCLGSRPVSVTPPVGIFPYWLLPVVRHLALQLDACVSEFESESKSESDTRLAMLSRSAWALASAFQSPRLLSFFMQIEPAVATALDGLPEQTRDQIDELAKNPLVTVTPAVLSSLEASCTLSQFRIQLSQLTPADELKAVLSRAESDFRQVETAFQRDLESALYQALTGIRSLIVGAGTLSAELKRQHFDVSLENILQHLTSWADLVDRFKPRSLANMPPGGSQLINSLPAMGSAFEAAEKQLIEVANIQTELSSGDVPAGVIAQKGRLITVLFDGITEEIASVDELVTVIGRAPVTGWQLESEIETEVDIEVEADSPLSESDVNEASRIAELEQQLATQAKDIEALSNENRKQRYLIETLQDQLDGKSYSAANDEGVNNITPTFLSTLTPIQVVDTLVEIYPDRLRVLPSAYDSLKGAESITARSLADRLLPLITTGLDIVRSGRPLIEMRNVVPGELSCMESLTVRSQEQFTRPRTFKDGDTERTLYPHLSLDLVHRMHFEYDSDEDRLIIGYIGRHLPTARHST